MKEGNFTVNEQGKPQICPIPRSWDLLENPYRFYRFLTEIDDVLKYATDESNILPTLHKLVRKLVINSYWVQTQIPEIDPKTQTGVCNLYDEIGYPLTVQTVIFAPGVKSSIHNHGTWGIVAILKGQEKNTFWRRVDDSNYEAKITPVEEITLKESDIISFTSEAIHSVEAVGDEALVTFNIYGETNHKTRFEFDPLTHQAKNY
jgi:predicted metal-dependent enzyme (double-stranded beta helix superfamily)